MYPPTKESFWMPILNGVVAFLLGFGVGWTVYQLIGAMYPENGGLLFGSGFGSLIWLVDHIIWLGIINRFLIPPWLRVYEEQQAEEDPDEKKEENRMLVTDGRTELIYLDDAPTTVTDYILFKYARGIMLDGLSTAYSDWTRGEFHPITEDSYKALCGWFIQRGWGYAGNLNQLVLTDYGRHILDLISRFGIHSPTQTNRMA